MGHFTSKVNYLHISIFFLAYLAAKFAKDIVVIGEKALSREIFLQKE